MKTKLFFNGKPDEDQDFAICMHHSSDAYGPHISTDTDEFGFQVLMFYSREEIILLKDWCDHVLRK